MPGNQPWAQHAPVLMISVAKTTCAMNDKPNAHAWHDVGLATGNLLAEAVFDEAEALEQAVYDVAHVSGSKGRGLSRMTVTVARTSDRVLTSLAAVQVAPIPQWL